MSNLKLGGIFIADTDLFQRDITKLLNSDISAVYKQLKNWPVCFRVYFREIGAEGKLRDVTTAIDELVHRKDRLIHFVRKQIHSESNNTHISWLEVWRLSGPMGIWNLQHSASNVLEAIDTTGPYFVEVHRVNGGCLSAFGIDSWGCWLAEQEVINFIESYPYITRKRRNVLFI